MDSDKEQHRAYLEEYYVVMASLVEIFYTRLWQDMRMRINYKTTRKWIFDNISNSEIKKILIEILCHIKMTLDEFGE